MHDDAGNECYHAVCTACASTYARMNGENLVRPLTDAELAADRREPRVVGGVYKSGYWGNSYVVLAMSGDGEITSLWLGDATHPARDGFGTHVTKHRTRFDWSRDSINRENVTKSTPTRSLSKWPRMRRNTAVGSTCRIWASK